MPLIVALIVEIICLIFDMPGVWAFIFGLLVLWIGRLTKNRLTEQLNEK